MYALSILSVIFLTLMLAFYAGLDSAFAAASRLHFELKKKQGLRSGRVLSALFEQPLRYAGFTLTGYYVFFTLLILQINWIWEAWMNSSRIRDWLLIHTNLPSGFLLQLLLSSIVVVLIGEFIPKTLFKINADKILNRFAQWGLITLSENIFWPIAHTLSRLTIQLLEIFFNVHIDRNKAPFSRPDLEKLFQQSHLNEKAHGPDTALIEAALTLPEVRIRECLVPRKEVEAIEVNASLHEVRKKFTTTKLSKLVVYEHTIDQVIGYIHQLDLFKSPEQIRQFLLPIPAVPESMSVSDLIGQFTKERKSIAWVVDEFGGTAGIVTMEDLLEELFGEIRDEFDVEELEEKKVNDREYLFAGRLELDYLNSKYGFDLPESASETLSGYIIHEHEMIPRQKDRIILGKYEFEIVAVSDTRIERVRLRILA
jgi:CBS domain containing-hemolysin-like protein